MRRQSGRCKVHLLDQQRDMGSSTEQRSIDDVTTLTIVCSQCATATSVDVRHNDLVAWRNGVFAQVAFPYLTNGERESLISGVCGPCFDAMFPDEDKES